MRAGGGGAGDGEGFHGSATPSQKIMVFGEGPLTGHRCLNRGPARHAMVVPLGHANARAQRLNLT